MTAVWIALLAVFLALIPAMIAASNRQKAKRSDGSGGDAGGSTASYSGSSDCGGDGGGGCD